MSIITYYRPKYLMVSLAFLLSGLAVIHFGFTTPTGIETSGRNSVTVIKNIFSVSLNAGNLKTNLPDQNFQGAVFRYFDEDMLGRANFSLPRHVRLKK